MKRESVPPLRLAIAGLIAMAAAMGIGRFVFTPILPGMMQGLGLDAGQAGLIASANYLGYLVGALLAAGGWAHGRERAAMLVGLGSNAVLLGAMALTQSLPVFIAIRFLAGVASAFLMVFLSAIVFSRLAAAGRDGLQALHFGGVGIGISASAILTGWIFATGYGWKAAWIAAAALSALAFFAVWPMARDGPAVAAGAGREPALPKSTALTRIIVAYGLFGAGYIVTATFLVAIVRQQAGGPLAESAVWLATGVAGIPSVWLWSRIARRMSMAAAFALGCVVEAVGIAASVALPSPLGPLLGGALLGGTFIAVTALGLQIGRQLAAAAPRRALALMTAAFGTGQILGPIAAGYAADWTGSFLAPSLGAAMILLACAVIGWSARDGSLRAR